jgi:hypothetical protein
MVSALERHERQRPGSHWEADWTYHNGVTDWILPFFYVQDTPSKGIYWLDWDEMTPTRT